MRSGFLPVSQQSVIQGERNLMKSIKQEISLPTIEYLWTCRRLTARSIGEGSQGNESSRWDKMWDTGHGDRVTTATKLSVKFESFYGRQSCSFSGDAGPLAVSWMSNWIGLQPALGSEDVSRKIFVVALIYYSSFFLNSGCSCRLMLFSARCHLSSVGL